MTDATIRPCPPWFWERTLVRWECFELSRPMAFPATSSTTPRTLLLCHVSTSRPRRPWESPPPRISTISPMGRSSGDFSSRPTHNCTGATLEQRGRSFVRASCDGPSGGGNRAWTRIRVPAMDPGKTLRLDPDRWARGPWWGHPRDDRATQSARASAEAGDDVLVGRNSVR